MGASRRMSVCLEDTKSTNHGKKILTAAEWTCLSVILAFWGYFMFEVLRPNKANHINLFGITFYKGSAFNNLCFNAIIYINFYSCANAIMMLASKHSNKARSLCGYNNVDSRQSLQMTILTAIYFTTIISTSTGLGDLFPVSCISMTVATFQTASFYFLSGQFIFSLFWRDIALTV